MQTHGDIAKCVMDLDISQFSLSNIKRCFGHMCSKKKLQNINIMLNKEKIIENFEPQTLNQNFIVVNSF
jgi:hypothetical protein